MSGIVCDEEWNKENPTPASSRTLKSALFRAGEARRSAMKMRNPFKRKPSHGDLHLEEAVTASPAIIFANLMLCSMSESHEAVRILRKSEQLTPAQHNGEELQPPTLTQLTNRFKVMSGLDPVHYQKEVRGQIQLSISSKQYLIRTTFNDEIDELCRIEFIDPDWEQNNNLDHISGSRKTS
jgi:hypothetical protein